MSLVLNEYEWAENAISNHDLGRKPVETLNRVAKYYFYNHYSKREVRHQLDLFLLQCDPMTPLVQWSGLLDKIAGNVDKYKLIQVDGVDIYEEELARIAALRGRQIKRLAFTLLCAAKYWDAASERNDHWVNTADREIMQMANINTSIKRQSLMYGELNRDGLIRFSKKIDNLNVRVLFTGGERTAMHITDYRNLGYQYLKYCGEPYFECENCGLTVRLNNTGKDRGGRRQKYCPSCAVEVHMRQIVDSVMRQRSDVQQQQQKAS